MQDKNSINTGLTGCWNTITVRIISLQNWRVYRMYEGKKCNYQVPRPPSIDQGHRRPISVPIVYKRSPTDHLYQQMYQPARQRPAGRQKEPSTGSTGSGHFQSSRSPQPSTITDDVLATVRIDEDHDVPTMSICCSSHSKRARCSMQR